MKSRPTLLNWHGPKAPRIHRVRSLVRSISPNLYDGIYWIAKIKNNVIVEYYPLSNWHFTNEGQLIGDVFTPEKQTVEIPLDESIILSLK